MKWKKSHGDHADGHAGAHDDQAVRNDNRGIRDESTTHDTRGRDERSGVPATDERSTTRDSRHDEPRGDVDRKSYSDAKERVAEGDRHQREEFGGMHFGAGFFGWIVAIGMAILLFGITGAVAAGVGASNSLTRTDLESQSGSIGIGAAIVLLVVLMLSYYAGGYVAGRMSRFNGIKQGLAVWLIGLLVTIIAAGAGAIFGSQYNILSRVSIPNVPIPTQDLGIGGAIAAGAVLLGTLLAAILGGKAGTHFHRKIDKVW